MGLRSLKDFCESRNIEMRLEEPLSKHTSLRVGGPAQIALFPDETSFAGLVALLVRERTPYTVLGGGTNVLVGDEGLEGAVIFTERMHGMALECREGAADSGAEVRVLVQPGCPLRKVMGFSLEHGLSGIEGLAGIPGTVGGAIAGNAGSFGCEIKDVLLSSTVVLDDGSVRTLSAREIGFTYRSTCLPRDAIILGSIFSFRRDEPQEVKNRVRQCMAEKKSRQPIGQHSAGCVFKNPEGISAGALIDESGCKGMRIGGIEVSSLHANFFINSGGGSARDFLRLMDVVAEKVNARFGILLQPEIKIFGRGGSV